VEASGSERPCTETLPAVMPRLLGARGCVITVGASASFINSCDRGSQRLTLESKSLATSIASGLS